MKSSTLVCFSFFLLGVLLGLIQLWLKTWAPEVFSKIILTDLALFAVSLVWNFLVRENKASEKMRSKNGLD